MTGEGNGLPGLPKGWVWTTLDEIALIILGQSPPSSTYNEDGVGLPFYQGKAEFGDTYPTPRKWCSQPKKTAEKGDALISVRAPVGPTNICPDKSCIGRGLAAIRGLDGIQPRFILYMMRSSENVIAGRGTGTTFKAITGSQLRGFEIPLPPLAEQHRIVAKIEELFTQLGAGVAALEKAKAQLRRYRQAVLKAAVEGELTREWREAHRGELEPASGLLERIKEGCKKQAKKKRTELPPLDTSDLPELPDRWAWARLGLCSEHITKGESPKWQGFDYVDDGIPFIRSENVRWGSVNLSSIVRIPEEFHSKLKRSQVRASDVLINLVGASIGRCAVVPPTITDANINQAVALIRVTDALRPFYLMYLLISPLMQKEVHGSKVETARPNISLTDLKHLVIPFPPLFEQQKIVEEIERCLSVADEMEKAVEQSLKRAERLRQSILKRAFEGKLVPQDPSDEPASVLLERIKAEKARREGEGKGKRKGSRRKRRKPEKAEQLMML